MLGPNILRVRWLNCIALTQILTCIFSHIRREGKAVADALAKNCLNLPSLHSQWWPDPPLFILPFVTKRQYRFTFFSDCHHVICTTVQASPSL